MILARSRDKEKNIKGGEETRRSTLDILTRRRRYGKGEGGCDKYSQSDINEVKRRLRQG